MAKSRRKDANDGGGIAVEPEGAAENVRVGTKVAVPQGITDHDIRRETQRVVLRAVQPPNLRGCPQHGEVVEADENELDALGLFDSGQVGTTAADRAHILQIHRLGL